MINLKISVFLLAALFIIFSFSARADLVTMHFATDAEMLEFLSDTLLIGEGRIGDLGGAATFELDLGSDTGSPAQTAQYDWQSGAAEPFTLTYESSTGLVTFSLGGETLNYCTPYFDFNEIFVRTRAVDDNSCVTVIDLVVDGEVVGDFSGAAGPGGLDILFIWGAHLSDGFVIEGVATLTWIGDPPT